jgi:pyruvate,water dikinase
MVTHANTMDFRAVGLKDLEQVGGKNASLGEMMAHLSESGVRVPEGFATTADAFRHFLAQNGLDQQIYTLLEGLDVEDVRKLAEVGKKIRDLITETPFLSDFEADVRQAYQVLADQIGQSEFSVAVRSSATAEDLPDASFAGQQETFLNRSRFSSHETCFCVLI